MTKIGTFLQESGTSDSWNKGKGWYWYIGHLVPIGPFDTEREAISDSGFEKANPAEHDGQGLMSDYHA